DVAGKLYHGFTGTDNQSADAVKADIASGGNRTVDELDLESGAAQALGYYNLYTTGNAQATVNLEASPLTVTISGTTYYVPYQLSYSTAAGNDKVVVTGSSLGSVATANTTGVDAVDADVMETTANGLRWKTLSLAATFNGTGNTTFGLPESDAYTGSIKATVTAE
ncbi:MAG: hypothetical protein JXK93_06480, partial [Sphaerochaetaceae bacterium]|nr:hypothetical protein [Sphaerochaetaceae bacterium]